MRVGCRAAFLSPLGPDGVLKTARKKCISLKDSAGRTG
jgi:hypothetical protein